MAPEVLVRVAPDPLFQESVERQQDHLDVGVPVAAPLPLAQGGLVYLVRSVTEPADSRNGDRPYQRRWARSSTPWSGARLRRSSRPASTPNRSQSLNSM